MRLFLAIFLSFREVRKKRFWSCGFWVIPAFLPPFSAYFAARCGAPYSEPNQEKFRAKLAFPNGGAAFWVSSFISINLGDMITWRLPIWLPFFLGFLKWEFSMTQLLMTQRIQSTRKWIWRPKKFGCSALGEHGDPSQLQYILQKKVTKNVVKSEILLRSTLTNGGPSPNPISNFFCGRFWRRMKISSHLYTLAILQFAFTLPMGWSLKRYINKPRLLDRKG